MLKVSILTITLWFQSSLSKELIASDIFNQGVAPQTIAKLESNEKVKSMVAKRKSAFYAGKSKNMRMAPDLGIEWGQGAAPHPSPENQNPVKWGLWAKQMFPFPLKNKSVCQMGGLEEQMEENKYYAILNQNRFEFWNQMLMIYELQTLTLLTANERKWWKDS